MWRMSWWRFMRGTCWEKGTEVVKLIVVIALGLVVLGLAGVAVRMRLAVADPAIWHVDPAAASDPATPHFARIAEGEVVGGGDIAARIDAAMLAMPRTVRIAGTVAEGWMTYETRSRLMAYPDYTSVRVVPVEGGMSFAAFARARFGESDWGVNAARLDALRAALR